MKSLIAWTIFLSPLAFAEGVSSQTCEKILALTHNDAIRSEIAQLETQIAKQKLKQHNIVRPSQTRMEVLLERMMFLLARGESDEIVEMLVPSAALVGASYQRIMALRAASNEQALKEYAQQSYLFGANYTVFKVAMHLLESVAAGKGIPDVEDVKPVGEGPEGQVVYDLKQDRSVLAARRVIAKLSKKDTPSTEQARSLFKDNPLALVGKLKDDLAELKKINRMWLRAADLLSQFYISAAHKIPWVPVRYRRLLLNLAGIQYDRVMLNRYLDKIQAVVEVSRPRTRDGKIVLAGDEATLEMQMESLIDLNSATMNDELLVTFARFGFHARVWHQLILAVEKKGQTDYRGAGRYRDFHERMLRAEQKARELGEMPFLYDPATSHYVQFLLIQAAYALATEEAVRNYVMPILERLLH